VTPSSGHASEAIRLRTLVLIAAIAAGIYLCYLLAEPFLSALTWALALCVLFTPFQRWLELKLKHSLPASRRRNIKNRAPTHGSFAVRLSQYSKEF
jgi:predicted PurR-regulated permease PerM